MVTIYLIRHGQKEEVFGDPQLTPIGVKQAEYTAKHLKNNGIRHVFASPLNRTVETATIIGSELQLPITKDARLRERMNWGDKPDETFEELMEEWTKTDRDRDYQPSHGDSSRNAGKRIELLLQDVSRVDLSGSILLVSHGGVIGDFLRNVFPERDLPIIKNPETHARYIDIMECSITIVKRDKDTYRLEQVGDLRHLPIPLI